MRPAQPAAGAGRADRRAAAHGAASPSSPSSPRATAGLAGASAPSRRMSSGTGISRCRSSGHAPGLGPVREHPVVAGGDHLAQFPRERPRLGPEHRHRREQPAFLVVEVEMPGNGVGSPRRHPEPTNLCRRAAHRQAIAQPVGVGERQGRVRDPRARGPLAGPGRARLCSVLAAHRSSSPAGLSTTMRARRR